MFSSDGSRVVSAGISGTLRIWASNTFEPLLTIRKHSTIVRSITFSPDGLCMATAADDAIRLFDARPLKQVLADRKPP